MHLDQSHYRVVSWNKGCLKIFRHDKIPKLFPCTSSPYPGVYIKLLWNHTGPELSQGQLGHPWKQRPLSWERGALLFLSQAADLLRAGMVSCLSDKDILSHPSKEILWCCDPLGMTAPLSWTTGYLPEVMATLSRIGPLLLPLKTVSGAVVPCAMGQEK